MTGQRQQQTRIELRPELETAITLFEMSPTARAKLSVLDTFNRAYEPYHREYYTVFTYVMDRFIAKRGR